VRKLEFHLAAALEAGADVVVTCGAVTSNHCRATVLACARVGLATRLLLRTPDGRPPPRVGGNHLLHVLGGAELRFITPAEYDDRDELMAAEAERLAAAGRQAWVIPEGASDELGLVGFEVAALELADQLAAAGIAPAAVWHAASSAGTTAGLIFGFATRGLPYPILGTSVGEPAAAVRGRVRALLESAATRWEREPPVASWEVTDDYVGGGYGVASPAEIACQAEATRLTGMLFDPTYTGKALYGLRAEIGHGRFGAGDDVVFWHTGGGFAVFERGDELLASQPSSVGAARSWTAAANSSSRARPSGTDRTAS